MVVDHTGSVVFGTLIVEKGQNDLYLVAYILMRLIGRLAFPLFCFLISEGVNYTHNLKQYVCRLWMFACISEVPYDFMRGTIWNPNAQNVGITLALAATAELIAHTSSINRFVCYGIASGIAAFLHADYGAAGVALIFLLISSKDKQKKIAAAICGSTYSVYYMFTQLHMGYLFITMSTVLIGTILYWIIRHYSPVVHKQKPRRFPKYWFYAVYPGHMLVLGMFLQIIYKTLDIT